MSSNRLRTWGLNSSVRPAVTGCAGVRVLALDLRIASDTLSEPVAGFAAKPKCWVKGMRQRRVIASDRFYSALASKVQRKNSVRNVRRAEPSANISSPLVRSTNR